MTPIHDLSWMAEWLNVSDDWLTATMEADTLGEYTGEPYPTDGQVLYTMVRVLRPEWCLEIGTGQGGSAAHIALALQHNGGGHLLSIDIEPSAGLYNTPPELHGYIATICADINLYIDQLSSYDFIHEDGNHSAYQIHRVYQRVQDGLLNPGGVILSHDALMFSDTPGLDSIGEYIRYGIEAAGLTFPPVEYLRPAPLSCGFTVYRKPA